MKKNPKDGKEVAAKPIRCPHYGEHRYVWSQFEPRYSNAGLAGSLGGLIPAQSISRLILWCECGDVKVIPIV